MSRYTGVFTVPVSGLYIFLLSVVGQGKVGDFIGAELRVDGEVVGGAYTEADVYWSK